MVRKRTRKYESDDNDSDSDVDFDFENQSRPAAKKYSLRERKAPLLTDFDYYGLDEEDEAKKASSDDEDFEVEADANGEVARSYFEPDPAADPQNAEGLIDFEDIIRADIVVNKNKIDYDNIIQKTEIKLTQPPKRRGRKPKNRDDESVKKEEVDDDETKFVCEPDIASLEPLERSETSEVKDESRKADDGEVAKPAVDEKTQDLPNGALLESLENGDLKSEEVESVAAKDGSKIEMVMVAPPPPEAEDEGQKTEEEDDDVIVLGELKDDVIVLDD